MAKLTEIRGGSYTDAFPKITCVHKLCTGEGTIRPFKTIYPYCPYCGEKITHVELIKTGFEGDLERFLEDRGYICV